MHKNNSKEISQGYLENSTALQPRFDVVKFQRKNINCTILPNGKIYVAIKPICDAIGIDSKRALLTIKQDTILGAMVSEQILLDSINRKFPMQCIPLEFVHGWLFTINENKVNDNAKPKLIAFKKDCYQVLFNHFYGKYEFYEQNLNLKRSLYLERKVLQEKIKDLNYEVSQINKKLRQIDHADITGQFELPVKGGMRHE